MRGLNIWPFEDYNISTRMRRFSLDKRWFSRDMIAIFKYWKGCPVEKGFDLFCLVLVEYVEVIEKLILTLWTEKNLLLLRAVPREKGI